MVETSGGGVRGFFEGFHLSFHGFVGFMVEVDVLNGFAHQSFSITQTGNPQSDLVSSFQNLLSLYPSATMYASVASSLFLAVMYRMLV